MTISRRTGDMNITPSPAPASVLPVSPPPPAQSQNDPVDRVVIVGAGPAGMATAIELAQNGIASTVLEKRGEVGTREPLLNVIPPLADRLAALDPSLVDLLSPTEKMTSFDQHGRQSERRFNQPTVEADAARSRGDIQALINAAGSPKAPNADHRAWSKLAIGDLDNALRELASTKYSDLIDVRFNTGVSEVKQHQNFAEAILESDSNNAVKDSVKGALLIDASGRNLLHSTRTVYPEKSFWVGGRFEPRADGKTETTNRYGSTASSEPLRTIALPGKDRTIVWAQIPKPHDELSSEAQRNELNTRAKEVGVNEDLASDRSVMPVTVQLWTSNEPAKGRIFAVGDSVRAPYFMTSTGAATALIHDVPHVVDSVKKVFSGGNVDEVSQSYSDAVKGANEALISLVRPQMLRDLNIDPSKAEPPTTSA